MKVPDSDAGAARPRVPLVNYFKIEMPGTTLDMTRVRSQRRPRPLLAPPDLIGFDQSLTPAGEARALHIVTIEQGGVRFSEIDQHGFKPNRERQP